MASHANDPELFARLRLCTYLTFGRFNPGYGPMNSLPQYPIFFFSCWSIQSRA